MTLAPDGCRRAPGPRPGTAHPPCEQHILFLKQAVGGSRKHLGPVAHHLHAALEFLRREHALEELFAARAFSAGFFGGTRRATADRAARARRACRCWPRRRYTARRWPTRD